MMTTEEAWRHLLKQAPAKDAKDAEAMLVLGIAVFDNLGSIAKSLDRIAGALENPEGVRTSIYNAISESLWAHHRQTRG